MPEIPCQQALERVLTYLRNDGVELCAETCQQVLRLVGESLADGDGPDLPARCIDRLPDYFDLDGMDIPASGPPLERGHIGYYPHE